MNTDTDTSNLDNFRLPAANQVPAGTGKAWMDEFRTRRVANACGISITEAKDLIATW